MHDPQQAEEGILTPSNPFADNDVFTNISGSEFKEEDQDDQDLDVENEPQVDPNPALAPTQRPK